MVTPMAAGPGLPREAPSVFITTVFSFASFPPSFDDCLLNKLGSGQEEDTSAATAARQATAPGQAQLTNG